MAYRHLSTIDLGTASREPGIIFVTSLQRIMPWYTHQSATMAADPSAPAGTRHPVPTAPMKSAKTVCFEGTIFSSGNCNVVAVHRGWYQVVRHTMLQMMPQNASNQRSWRYMKIPICGPYIFLHLGPNDIAVSLTHWKVLCLRLNIERFLTSRGEWDGQKASTEGILFPLHYRATLHQFTHPVVSLEIAECSLGHQVVAYCQFTTHLLGAKTLKLIVFGFDLEPFGPFQNLHACMRVCVCVQKWGSPESQICIFGQKSTHCAVRHGRPCPWCPNKSLQKKIYRFLWSQLFQSRFRKHTTVVRWHPHVGYSWKNLSLISAIGIQVSLDSATLPANYILLYIYIHTHIIQRPLA